MMAKEVILKIEDQQIGLMEQAEAAQRELGLATQAAAAAKKLVDDQITLIDQREVNLKKELAELQQGRSELAAAVDETIRNRGVCGGCHMKLPAQNLVNARSQQEVAACPNCGRILYFTSGMDMTLGD